MRYAENEPRYEVLRNDLVNKVEEVIRKQGKHILSLYGMSGIGKTHLCRALMEAFTRNPEWSSVLIDLDQPEYNNIPRIIECIISTGLFEKTSNLLNEYYDSVDASKTDILENCITALIEELNETATEKRLLLIFDTFEALPVETKNKEFKRLIEGVGAGICIVISGIEKAQSDYKAEEICIQGFTTKEIQDFFIHRDKSFKKLFKEQGNLEAEEIRIATDDGHPIICGLLSDYLVHHANTKDIQSVMKLLRQTLDESPNDRNGHLISWIDDLSENLKNAIQLTAYFNDRMTPEMLSKLSKRTVSECKTTIDEMRDFSFIKSYPGEPQITMHQVAADMIRSKFHFPANELDELTSRAVDEYDRMIRRDLQHSQAVRSQTSLRVGKVICLVRNGSFDVSLRTLDEEVLNALESFDYSLVTQLVSAVENWYCEHKEIADQRWACVVELCKGELLLSQYKAEDTLNLVNSLMNSSAYHDNSLKAMIDSLYGRTLVNPCTVDKADTLAVAIKTLTSSLSQLEELHFDYRAVKTALWLGIAYTRDGQNEYARAVFHYARENCFNKLQEISILLEISKMIRLEQTVEESNHYMQECYRILAEGLPQKNKGKLYYYQGNVYRDLGDFPKAVEYYEKAFEELMHRDDEFTLCELNLDYAWLEYIWKEKYDRDKVIKYLDIGWELAKKYKFGTEFSEYYHMRYELEHYEKLYEQSYDDLMKALDYAYQYNNVYMILDCLNHKAQMHFEKGEYDLIPAVIDEMERIEDGGCKIHVFTGRAMLVQGDVYYQNKRWRDAFMMYLNGFLIVALYGNSYSNVELFGDLYNSRQKKLVQCSRRIIDSSTILNEFKAKWMANNVNSVFGYFIDSI